MSLGPCQDPQRTQDPPSLPEGQGAACCSCSKKCYCIHVILESSLEIFVLTVASGEGLSHCILSGCNVRLSLLDVSLDLLLLGVEPINESLDVGCLVLQILDFILDLVLRILAIITEVDIV